jgi:hypothetical protein
MSDTESTDYLQPGFDPNTMTVPQLRSILVQHNIQYPASAKKPQLVELFTENILPQSRRLLAARSRAKRTSKGITDAESSQEGTVDADVDAELMPPPPTPRARAKKSSTRVKQEESGSDTAARSPTKKTPRASSKRARASDTETGPDGETVKKTVRKVRKSEAPAIKAEEEEPRLPLPRAPVAEGSPFSDDNPFQSGSSPLAAIRSTSGDSRRQTLGATVKDPNRRKSPSTPHRRTDVPQANDGITPPSSKTFNISIKELNKMKSVDDDGVEAGEEFTPEAQMELVRERSQNGQSAIVPRRSAKKQPKGMSSAGPIWVVLLTLLGGYATWYRQEKLAVGYCGVGREPHHIVSDKVPQFPDWAIAIAEPQCESCPQHAYCYEQLKTKCEPDFVLKHHPLSLGGLIPLPPTCEPDGEKVRRIKVVADRAVEELRERRAKFECGDLVDEEGVPLASVEIDANDLKKEVSKKRRKGMSEAEFEDLWAGALGEIEGREEVESSSDGYAFYDLQKLVSFVFSLL